jgi:hypothetical protein
MLMQGVAPPATVLAWERLSSAAEHVALALGLVTGRAWYTAPHSQIASVSARSQLCICISETEIKTDIGPRSPEVGD